MAGLFRHLLAPDLLRRAQSRPDANRSGGSGPGNVICVAKDIQKFKRDRHRGSFKGWLCNLTRWRIADQLRKAHRPVAGRGGGRPGSISRWRAFPSWPTNRAGLDWETGMASAFAQGGHAARQTPRQGRAVSTVRSLCGQTMADAAHLPRPWGSAPTRFIWPSIALRGCSERKLPAWRRSGTHDDTPARESPAEPDTAGGSPPVIAYD